MKFIELSNSSTLFFVMTIIIAQRIVDQEIPNLNGIILLEMRSNILKTRADLLHIPEGEASGYSNKTVVLDRLRKLRFKCYS